MAPFDSSSVRVAPEVRDALSTGRGVVALETTLLVHGLPAEDAEDVGARLEALVRAHGAVPATVGVVHGEPVVGLSEGEIRRLIAARDTVRKLSTRDLGFAMAAGLDGATTVAATISLAATAGVEVMATGGLGGVHLGAKDTFDESADLVALSRTPVLVVASGVKSILDVAATLERLDTLGVAVAGYRTTRFPGFYVADSGQPVGWTIQDAPGAARAFLAHRAVASTGMLLANPVPAAHEMDPALHRRVLDEGLWSAGDQGVAGPDVTPFLLAHFAAETGGTSVAANVALVLDNAALAADVAVALASSPAV